MPDPPPNLRDVFCEALAQPTPEEQRTYLDRVCRERPELRARVEELLRAHTEAADFLPEPPAASGTANGAFARPRAAAGAPAGTKPFVLVDGAGSTNLGLAELEGLLRRRLLIGAGIVVVWATLKHAWKYFALYQAHLHGTPFWWQQWGVLVADVAVSVIAAVVLVVLLVRKKLPLRLLRRLELVAVGVFCADLLVSQSYFLTVVAPMRFGEWGTEGAARAWWRVAPGTLALDWVILLVGYGMLIPNTWRRCASVVGAIVLAAWLVWALVFLNASPSFGDRLDFFLSCGFWVLGGAALAVFGSHRLETLRQQAQQARQLGQYVLKRKLGSGGMGEVYLAEHRLLKRPCAVKVVRPERVGDAALLHRFAREVEATTRLTHPNAVQVYDYGHTDDGTFFYAMEYLPGLTLEELVRRYGPLPPERVVHLLRQVCGALREAHALGLIHRDIKPGNIMVCRLGGRADVVKLLDFGLVHDLGHQNPDTKLTRAGSILGSPEFMSPEQARGEPVSDPRGDLYSLAATAYYALTGQPPFTRPTYIETLYAHLNSPVRPLTELCPDVPADLQAVILRCLAKDSAARVPDAASLEEALRGCACADRWSEAQATAWWLAVPESCDPSTTEMPHDHVTLVPAG